MKSTLLALALFCATAAHAQDNFTAGFAQKSNSIVDALDSKELDRVYNFKLVSKNNELPVISTCNPQCSPKVVAYCTNMCITWRYYLLEDMQFAEADLDMAGVDTSSTEFKKGQQWAEAMYTRNLIALNKNYAFMLQTRIAEAKK